jgi:hypothetical protein
MYTSAVLIALSGCLSQAAQVPDVGRWKTDYSVASRIGQREGKPLAVFIGSGGGGWEKLSKDGSLSKEAKQLLDAHYVCLYVDTTLNGGRQLARSFDMDGRGLVISDRTGNLQAFRHRGELSGSDLTWYLRRYSESSHTVRTTETAASFDTSYRSSAPPATTSYQPAYVPSGGFSGGRSC